MYNLLKYTIAFCMFVFFAGCGTLPEFENAERHYLFQEYQQAIEYLNLGLQKEPDSEYHRILRKVCQHRLAQQNYKQACQYLSQERLLDAERNLEAVLQNEPQHYGASMKCELLAISAK